VNRLACLLIPFVLLALEPTAAADSGASALPPEPRAPRWPWIGPGLQVATIAGSTGISLANGIAPGRFALDSVGASLGATVGVLGTFFLVKNHGLGNDALNTIFVALPVAIGASALGGLALAEAIRSSESPLPARTVWPAFGGFAVGAVIDIAAFATASSSSPQNEGATLVSALLSSLTIGTSTVAGYSITR